MFVWGEGEQRLLQHTQGLLEMTICYCCGGAYSRPKGLQPPQSQHIILGMHWCHSCSSFSILHPPSLTLLPCASPPPTGPQPGWPVRTPVRSGSRLCVLQGQQGEGCDLEGGNPVRLPAEPQEVSCLLRSVSKREGFRQPGDPHLVVVLVNRPPSHWLAMEAMQGGICAGYSNVLVAAGLDVQQPSAICQLLAAVLPIYPSSCMSRTNICSTWCAAVFVHVSQSAALAPAHDPASRLCRTRVSSCIMICAGTFPAQRWCLQASRPPTNAPT